MYYRYNLHCVLNRVVTLFCINIAHLVMITCCFQVAGLSVRSVELHKQVFFAIPIA